MNIYIYTVYIFIINTEKFLWKTSKESEWTHWRHQLRHFRRWNESNEVDRSNRCHGDDASREIFQRSREIHLVVIEAWKLNPSSTEEGRGREEGTTGPFPRGTLQPPLPPHKQSRAIPPLCPPSFPPPVYNRVFTWFEKMANDRYIEADAMTRTEGEEDRHTDFTESERHI